MFRLIVKRVLTAILRAEARAVIKKYRPKVIGVTGSVGKTGTKNAIAAVIARLATTRKSDKSYNNELGVPLTILGGEAAGHNVIGWIKIILEGLSLIFFQADYPRWLVLEIGADRPGDIRRMTSWLHFDVVVITRLPEVPVHVEFFASLEELSAEKLVLARAVGENGVVILNHDDPRVVGVAAELRSRILTYGFDEGATVKGSHDHLVYNNSGDRPNGLVFKVDYAGHNVPLRLPALYGHHQLYGVLAAVAVGVSQNLNLVTIGEALAELPPTPGRMNLIEGIKQTLIFDDSYNSSPAALESALQTLAVVRVAEGARRIAVLGDMMELGLHTIEAHRAAGRQVSGVCDFLLTVGPRAKFIAERATRAKLTKGRIKHFDETRAAGQALQKIIQPGDIILVKGSQAVRLERVVEEIMLHPEDKEKLLVRQESVWQNKNRGLIV